MSSKQTDFLIQTKLRIPYLRSNLVDRPQLQDQIAEGLAGPLTLITAPAGFGKTTLVATSLARYAKPVAWLSLDLNDNQTGRFLNYLVAALQGIEPSIGHEAAQMLATSPPAPLEAILTSLINDLDTAGKEMALVLDDYQVLQNQAAHTATVFLLEHLPRVLHLVIITRSDPPLPLARLRAHGQMVELRAADLRFTTSEATQFLNEVMDLNLELEAVGRLEERTEGWIAGLQMAALSMRNRDDKQAFVDAFSGTHRFILDYLLEEVLASQSAEVQHFLLCTSILERLTAPLCDALLKERTGDSQNVITPAATILAELERANLFLIPLDDDRRWYRYHHLFADLLLARLDQSYPGLAIQLHARAAAWLEEEGMTVEAINHALAAGEDDQAARLVEENTTRLLAKGELAALMSWIEALPAELHLSRPWLCIHQAYALTMAGQLDIVPQLLSQAEASVKPTIDQNLLDPGSRTDEREASPAQASETQALQGAIAAIRAMTAVMTGLDGEAVSQAQQARKLLPPENLWDRAAAAWALGYAHRSLGQLPEAYVAFEEQVRLGRAMGNIWTLVTGLNDLALVVQAQGQLRQARAFFEAGLAEASRQGARSLGYIARMEASQASVLYEQNELVEAGRLLADAIAHTRLWPNPNHLAYTYALQSRLQLVQKDIEGARASIEEADAVRRSAALTRLNRRLVEADLIRVWLALQATGGNLDPGDQLNEQAYMLIQAWQNELDELAERSVVGMDDAAEMAALSLARVFLAAGEFEKALSLLKQAIESARIAGRRDRLVSSLLLSAIARKPTGGNPTGQTPLALKELEEALSLAEPGGYVRIFLDEGQPVQMLIAQWLAHAQSGPLRTFAIHLLSQFDFESNTTTPTQEKSSMAENLVEQLSQRELEVLHLLALGRTNQEIASQLVVALGTVKAQTASIYRKLEVNNRTEAVARARQLRILP